MSLIATRLISLLLVLFDPSQVDADGLHVGGNSLENRFHIGNYSLARIRDVWSVEMVAPFDAAMAEFPTVQECTVGRGSELRLQWDQFQTEAEIEVCLFHLAEKLESPEALSLWFASTGFRHSIHDNFGKRFTVHASIRLDDKRAPNIPNLRVLIAKEMGRSISIGVRFDTDGAPFSTNFTINWN